jgi:hypothetical protein
MVLNAIGEPIVPVESPRRRDRAKNKPQDIVLDCIFMRRPGLHFHAAS